jgi:hypothetical protein
LERNITGIIKKSKKSPHIGAIGQTTGVIQISD